MQATKLENLDLVLTLNSTYGDVIYVRFSGIGWKRSR